MRGLWKYDDYYLYSNFDYHHNDRQITDIAFLCRLCYNTLIMPSELPSSPKDPAFYEADTEPIPVIYADLVKTSSEQNDDSSINRRIALGMIAFPLGCIAVGALLVNGPVIAYNVEAATSHTDQNNTVSELASDILGQPVRVDCNNESLDSPPDNAYAGSEYIRYGQVVPLRYLSASYSLPVMTIREELCDTLVDFDPTPSLPEISQIEIPTDEQIQYIADGSRYADAVSIVLHEGQHINQIHDEAEASCYTYQKLPDTLEALGMREYEAELVTNWSMGYLGTRLATEYYSKECAPDGAFDLGIDGPFLYAPSNETIADLN